MTTQPELDLQHGLPTCVPVPELANADGGTSAYNTASYTLEVNPSACEPLGDEALFEPVPTAARLSRSTGRSNRFHISVYLDEGRPFNPLANIAARRTYQIEGDQRLRQMRMALVNASLVAISNGAARLPEGYTMNDLHRLRGFRWNPYAGCSCPCSPAFSTPLVPLLSCRQRVRARRVRQGRYVDASYHTTNSANWMNVSFRVRENQSVATVYDRDVAEQVAEQISLSA